MVALLKGNKSTIMATFLLLFLLVATSLSAVDDTRVTLQLSDGELYSSQKVTGTITIQHMKNEELSPSSFTMEGKPLSVEFLRNVEISPQSDLVITFYRFSLPPQEAGLHILPSVKVNVGGRSYSTPKTTYEVKRASSATTSRGGVILELEPFVVGESPLYVGERLKVGYRIFFNGNIELTEQVLPLLDAAGFRKIGSERIGDVKERGLSVRQIEQEIEATEAGSYSFGPSYLIGHIYRNDWRGKTVSVGEAMRADAPPVEIVVLAFPEKGRPPSFNGSVGRDIAFKVSLETAATVTVGDKIILSLLFSSKNDLAQVKLPEICCQPGFPGFFDVDDIPPLPVKSAGSLLFSVPIRPLTPHVKEIPSIEFSYFDPKEGSFVVKRSEPIALKVLPLPKKQLPLSPETPFKENREEERSVTWPPVQKEGAPIEIDPYRPLDMGDLSNQWFGTWAVLLIIPIGALVLYIEWDLLARFRRRQATTRKKRSKEWLMRAEEALDDATPFYHYLSKALIERLYEKRWIASRELTSHQLPKGGAAERVANFLVAIEKRRYTGNEELAREEIYKRASTLYEEIENCPGGERDR